MHLFDADLQSADTVGVPPLGFDIVCNTLRIVRRLVRRIRPEILPKIDMRLQVGWTVRRDFVEQKHGIARKTPIDGLMHGRS